MVRLSRLQEETWETSTQSSGQRFAGKSLGQSSGRRTGPYSDQEAGRRDGWAIQPNSLPGRATGKSFRRTGVLGSQAK